MRRARIIFLFFISAMLLSLCGCSGEAVSLTELPDPSEAVLEFFDHLENEEYDKADEMLYNYSTLGMKRTEDIDGAVVQTFCRELNRQRKMEIVTEPAVSGRNAFMTIKVTTLDLRCVYEPLMENVTTTIHDMQYAGTVINSDEFILSVAAEELELLLSESDSITTTDTFTLELVYSGGQWKLIISDELYSALIGYAI